MKKNFDQKIDEMLVVLNAVKKPKESEGECEQMADPVTCAMNDALKSLGFTVMDKSDVKQPELDGVEDIEGRIEDLDLPRPAEDENADADDEDEGENNDDDASGSDENPFDPLGDGVEDVDDGDNEGGTNGDSGGVEDENDSDELKIKRLDNGDVVFSFGGNDVTVTKDNLSQIINFLGGESGRSDDSNLLDDDSDDDGFGNNGKNEDDSDGEEDD